jgi:hypothetical protein
LLLSLNANNNATEQSDAHGAADRAVCQWKAFSGGPVIAGVTPSNDCSRY